MELSKKKLPILATELDCTACLACENICPKRAINHYLAQDGHVYVHVDAEKCIGCMKCQNICIASRSCYGENDISSSKIYAAWANKADIRKSATSGGVFAALAETVINDGGCVVGAELNEFTCKHTVIYKKSEIYRLQGSKYMASSMEDVYKIISKELKGRDVLFAGLGCQCAGVIAYFKNFKSDFKLYTIDIVCGGVSSRILIDKYREQYPEVTGFVSFRTKDKYELIVKTKRGIKKIAEKSLPLHGFNCGMTNRYSCYDCQFAKAHRKSDITIGDLWDYSQFPDEHSRGISMIINHTQTGMGLIARSDVHLFAINWKTTLLQNKRIVCGHQHIYYPRLELTKAAFRMSEKRFKKLYTISMKPWDVSLFIFRLYRYVYEKMLAKKNEKTIITMVESARECDFKRGWKQD